MVIIKGELKVSFLKIEIRIFCFKIAKNSKNGTTVSFSIVFLSAFWHQEKQRKQFDIAWWNKNRKSQLANVHSEKS